MPGAQLWGLAGRDHCRGRARRGDRGDILTNFADAVGGDDGGRVVGLLHSATITRARETRRKSRVAHAAVGAGQRLLIVEGMETRTAAVNGLDIAYETFGEATDPPILLVMGLGTQMIAWPDEMCEELAAAGHFVIRFDNRDVGLDAPARGDGSATAGDFRAAAVAALHHRRHGW